MKLFYTCAKVLAMAAITAAAPQAVRSSEAISFPEQSQQPSVLTFEQAVGVMSPKNGGPVSTSATGNGGVSAQAGCRRNIFRKWGLLSAQEKSGFVGAIQCLMRTPPKGIWGGARSRYDELVWVHSEMTPRVHGSDMFLPWHRYYLFAFRQLLKKECGYRGPVPWWRETNNAGNFGASDIFSSQYFGALPLADGNGNGRCLSDGAFAGSRDPITGQCVARGEIRAETNFVSFANEDLCQGQQGATFSQHRACVEGTNHARLHRGIGPTMANAAVSPADPLFFLHHSYIDWQWKRWQNASPDRWQTISGCINTAGSCVPLTRKTVLTSLGLIRDSTVGKFLDTEGRLACYTYDELV